MSESDVHPIVGIVKVGARYLPVYLREGETIETIFLNDGRVVAGRKLVDTKLIYSRNIDSNGGLNMRFLHMVREYCHEVNLRGTLNAAHLDELFEKSAKK